MAGQVSGSDYYLVGGITELNFDIRSSGLNALGGNLANNSGGPHCRGLHSMHYAHLSCRLHSGGRSAEWSAY